MSGQVRNDRGGLKGRHAIDRDSHKTSPLAYEVSLETRNESRSRRCTRCPRDETIAVIRLTRVRQATRKNAFHERKERNPSRRSGLHSPTGDGSIQPRSRPPVELITSAWFHVSG
jgi:hypothetical protein